MLKYTHTHSELFLNMLAKLIGAIWCKTYCVHYMLIQNFYVVTWPVTVAEFILVQKPLTVCEFCSNLELPAITVHFSATL
jgi:hypothetical protein